MCQCLAYCNNLSIAAKADEEVNDEDDKILVHSVTKDIIVRNNITCSQQKSQEQLKKSYFPVLF